MMFPHWSKVNGNMLPIASCASAGIKGYQIFDGVHLLDECDRNEATNFSSMCEVLAFVFADDIF